MPSRALPRPERPEHATPYAAFSGIAGDRHLCQLIDTRRVSDQGRGSNDFVVFNRHKYLPTLSDNGPKRITQRQTILLFQLE